ncbi:SU10 major capsid protein [Pseudonocardia sp. T1-2H]|uniref:SU10 major capsid protein n=1 Tax=Pseudonocardia sp. T1-2H TaxID=3128899 RepID=UPI003100B6A0
MSQIREALTATGATALVPKVISRALLEYQRRYAPVIAAIPSFKWESDVYFFSQRDSNPNGGFVVDGGARVMSNSSYSQNGFPMAHTQIIGGVTGYAQAVTSGQIGDLLGKEVDGALRGHYWDLETAAMWGNRASTVNGAAPMFDGFDSLVSNYSGSSQNAIDGNAASFTLNYLDQLADMVETNAAMDVFNSSWMFTLSNTAWSRVSQLLVNNQRFVNQVEVAAGLMVPTYRGIPLVKTSFLAPRSYSTGAVTVATATTGGTLPAGTFYYKVSAIIARQGEILPSAEVSQVTTGATSTVTLTLPSPTGRDGLGPILYKVYRGSASNGETLLGVVDATVGLAADGITPVPTTSIVDTGTQLIPKNAATQPAVLSGLYAGTNAAKKPPAAGCENIFLVPRDEDYLCRPYVREAERLQVATTVAAPDTLPFAMQTDTTLALRAPKFIGGLFNIDTHLTNGTPVA